MTVRLSFKSYFESCYLLFGVGCAHVCVTRLLFCTFTSLIVTFLNSLRCVCYVWCESRGCDLLVCTGSLGLTVVHFKHLHFMCTMLFLFLSFYPWLFTILCSIPLVRAKFLSKETNIMTLTLGNLYCMHALSRHIVLNYMNIHISLGY